MKGNLHSFVFCNAWWCRCIWDWLINSLGTELPLLSLIRKEELIYLRPCPRKQLKMLTAQQNLSSELENEVEIMQVYENQKKGKPDCKKALEAVGGHRSTEKKWSYIFTNCKSCRKLNYWKKMCKWKVQTLNHTHTSKRTNRKEMVKVSISKTIEFEETLNIWTVQMHIAVSIEMISTQQSKEPSHNQVHNGYGTSFNIMLLGLCR